MPISSRAGKKKIIQWVKSFKNINTILDLGCGVGTYIKIFKEEGDILKNTKWTGVEVWTPYIEKFKLIDRYDNIINADIREVNFQTLGNFNLCFLGDVLEHVTKDQSIKLVNELVNYCDYVIISIPIGHWPQDAIEENPYEVHVKDDWSDSEVKETFPHIIDSAIDKKIGVYLLKK